MINLRNYQEQAKSEIYQAWNNEYKNVLLVLPTGMGKCLGEDTPVLMFDGSVKAVQDIKKGELLMGIDSKPRKVLSTCVGESDLYRITPVKGDPWICNDVHVLTLKHTSKNTLVDIPLNHYLKESKTFKHLHKQFRVGVDFKTRKTKFDPYLLGIYLAEGSYSQNRITSPEHEVLHYIRSWVRENEMRLNVWHGKGCKEIMFADIIQGWGKNKIKLLRQSCTKKETRWIPKEYLINSREVRLEVLAGILDGDGYEYNNCFEIITKYEQLSKDILYLCRSLGLAAYSKKVTKTIKSTNFSGEYHRINISGHTDMIPIKVERKKCRERKQIKSALKTGFKTENIGKGKYYGFELDNDGRFLLGDFTVTHNTKTFCSLVIDTLNDQNHSLSTAVQVHRKELVQQICLTFAEEGIPHNIIASRKDIKGIIAAERRMFNKQFYNPNSKVTIVSVDTLNSRADTYRSWAMGVQQWITDEAAHVLKDNKWGRAISLFKNARGLGVTATPERLDRKGLGSHADGVFDIMVEGPNSRWGIDNGFLSKYKIAIPESDYQNFLTSKNATSDYSKKAMMEASNKSQIVGDVVENYVKFAKGKQAILFASDVKTAKKMEAQFLSKGITAKELNGTTADSERLDALIKFRNKEIQVLLNVDLFDEGLDVPGIECVIMARPTKSLGKYLQMIGRGLRVAEGKPYLILIDHVGNVQHHGLPCDNRKWTLDRIKKGSKKLNFIRICSNIMCNSPYDRALTECPWCETETIVVKKGGESTGRIPPMQVDGDLFLIDPETIRRMEASSHLEDPAKVGEKVSNAVNGAAGIRAMKNQVDRIATQKELIKHIADWAGLMKDHYGYSDRMIHKKFYLYNNLTITEALGQPKAEMNKTIETLESEGRFW